MAPRKKSKQGPPWYFRPGPEIENMVESFAQEHGMQIMEACKAIVALAIPALDRRYYILIKQMADAMAGANAFVRSCVYIHSAMEGARLAMGKPIQADPE